jgi:hypothetical protein
VLDLELGGQAAAKIFGAAKANTRRARLALSWATPPPLPREMP